MDIKKCRICGAKGIVYNPNICIEWDTILYGEDVVIDEQSCLCNECRKAELKNR